MTVVAQSQSSAIRTRSRLAIRLWDGLGTALASGLAWLLLAIYLLPMVYMFVTAVKDDAQLRSTDAPIWPAQVVTYMYEGKDYPVYYVPTDQGVQQWALVVKGRAASEFVDPAHPDNGLISWDGSWRALDRVYEPHLTLDNFAQLWDEEDFFKLVRNTLTIAAIAGAGVVCSSILVAYGFSRFPVPGGRFLFIVLIATIMLPEKVSLIPTYIMYVRVLPWNGTWLPLIVPHLFGNAIMIFLLRQNFKSIPKEIEEAAVLDGAGPLRILTSIILPQAVPVVVTVALLQFFFFWNETRVASLYLGIAPNLWPVAFWLRRYGGFFPTFNLLQASALMVMIVPVIVLLLSQRIFMRGVLVTGTEK
jgi:multiple sugar transport system permease protein